MSNATATPSAQALAVRATGNPNPLPPPFADDMEWITAYLAVHMLSVPSRRYSYLLWFAFALVFLVYAFVHATGLRSGVLGAYWTKWAIRRRTWKTGSRKHGGRRIRFTYASNAQIISLALLVAVVAVLSCVGPDYIAPVSPIFDLGRRWDPLDFLGLAPQYTIPKAWWTAGGRTGMMAFALFPLCVLFALKAPPFAIFAIPRLVHLSFDKLSFLHRYTAYIIWILSAAHAALWSVQLWNDRRPTLFVDATSAGPRAYTYAWSYTKFIYAWIAFGLLTLLTIATASPLRKHHYETFYFLHILLVPMMIAMAALHHPPLWWWCWAALGLWVGERAWRGVRWLFINGYLVGKAKARPPRLSQDDFFGAPQAPGPYGITPFGLKESLSFPLPSAAPSAIQGGVVRGTQYPPRPLSPNSPSGSTDSHDKRLSAASSVDFLHSPAPGATAPAYAPPPGFAHAELVAGYTIRLTFTPARPFAWAPGQYFLVQIPAVSRFLTHPFTCASCHDAQAPAPGAPLVFLVRAKAGWTRDLGDLVARLGGARRTTAPGEELPSGWAPPRRGVVLRMCVDGPFGSSARVRWGEYATAVIVAGGSGVSFGLSVLEHLCLCMAGRDGRALGGQPGGWGMRGFRMSRVRFVWIVREYSHLQWCAAQIRRCMEIMPPPGLQVDIFVTNTSPDAIPRMPAPPLHAFADFAAAEHMMSPATPNSAMPLIEVQSPVEPTPPTMPALDPLRPVSSFAASFASLGALGSGLAPPGAFGSGLAPPAPQFARPVSGVSNASGASGQSGAYSAFDLSYYASAAGEGGSDDEGADGVADLTDWAGEDDTAMPGENRLSRRVQHAGTKRRSRAWRRSMLALGADPRASAYSEQSRLSAAFAGHAHTGSGASAPYGHARSGSGASGAVAGHARNGSGSAHPLGTANATPMSSSVHLLGEPGARAEQPPLEPLLIHGHSPLVPGVPSGSAPPHAHLHGPSKLGQSARMPSPISEGSDEELDDGTTAVSPTAGSRPDTPASAWDARSSVHSANFLFGPGAGAGPGHRRTRSEAVRLDVERREMQVLAAVAQFAYPGRPRVDAVLREEAARARGPLVVACCGPGALNTVVRKAVAAQIDPGAIARGDLRGSVALVAEEYEY